MSALEPDEAAMADKIYKSNKWKFIVPESGHRLTLPPESNAYNYIVYSARSTVERLIKRVRNLKLNKSVWRLDHDLHGVCLDLSCRIVNICFTVEPLG